MFFRDGAITPLSETKVDLGMGDLESKGVCRLEESELWSTLLRAEDPRAISIPATRCVEHGMLLSIVLGHDDAIVLAFGLRQITSSLCGLIAQLTCSLTHVKYGYINSSVKLI